jgi:drug/metabolite transporter (DMT)-like permease
VIGALSSTSLGVICILGSAFAFSLAGLFTRLIEVDVWTLLFWRGVFGGLTLFAWMVIASRGARFGSLKPAAWLVAITSALSTIAFINALRLTTVADVTVAFATTPFLAAILWRLRRGEWEKRSTLVASMVAFGGIIILAGPTLGAERSLLGLGLGIAAAALVAVMMVTLREHPEVSFVPAAGVSGFLCAMLVWPWAQPSNLQPSDLLGVLAFGSIQFALGLMLLIWGAQRLSPTRAGLLSSIETPLAPLLVWLVVQETPQSATLVGGAVVMAAVIGDLLNSKSN